MCGALQSCMQSKITSSVLLGIFIVGLFGSLFFTLGVANNQVLNDHCIFSQDGVGACAMEAQEHITAWQAVFSFLVPLVFTFFVVVGVNDIRSREAFYLKVRDIYKQVYIPLAIFAQQIDKLCYFWFYRPIQDLLSRGILHPIVYG